MFPMGEMEGTGDSYSEIMQRLQSSLAASSFPKSNANSLPLPQVPSHTLSNSQATLSQSQSLFQSQSHSLSQTPSSFAKTSPFLHTQSKPQAHPSRSLSQPLSQTHTASHAPTHSRSMSQPSIRSHMPPLQSQTPPVHAHSQHSPHSLSQPASQSPHSSLPLPQVTPRFPSTSQVSPPTLHTRSLSQPSILNQTSSGGPLSPPSMGHLPPPNSMSHSLFASFNSLTPNYPVKKEASQSLSDSSARTTVSLDVTMEESSPCPPAGSGPSSSNPLSPPLNPFHTMSQRYSNDLSQMPDSPPKRRGHRRAQSEIAFRQGSSFEKELRDESRDFDRDSVKESDMERELNQGRVDLDEDMDRATSWGRERHRDREGEEGAEDLFSMYIDMEKINSFSNSGAGDGGDSDREKPMSRVDAGKDRLKTLAENEKQTSGSVDENQRDRCRGPGEGDKERGRESWTKTVSDNDRGEGRNTSTTEEEKGDKNRVDEMRTTEKQKEKDDQEMSKGSERENWSRKDEEDEKETSSMCVENEGGKDRSDNEREKGKLDRSSPSGGTHHSRSVSMDGFLSNLHGYKAGDAGHLSSFSEDRRSRQTRHHHSMSMDGSMSLKMEFGQGEFEGIELKKAMASDKLADLALVDPKRAKRILANRQSAARSKERKMRYISELERKVQTLQTEATTLSAQLTMLQRDSTGLTTENSELKLRLSAMEQQAQLRDALNDALREEVQRLKLATGQLSNGQGMSLGQQMGVNPQLYQLHQQLQQQQQPQGNHQHQPVQQNSHADFLQRSAFGALQGLAGSLGGAFLKSEGNGIAVNQGSSASF
ncbi:hypothetical protein Mapa_001417 [Marchantia paleacea]|nr:hypothetical protein Mapa_001417 [Marchantia paleacea]